MKSSGQKFNNRQGLCHYETKNNPHDNQLLMNNSLTSSPMTHMTKK